MSSKAIAFDFDGTLINSGLDKGIHIMCAVWNAFIENNLLDFIHTDKVEIDVKRMLDAYIQYPGAPRFQQLNALINSLIYNKPIAFQEEELSSLPAELQKKYPEVKNSYNRVYSALNNTAAEIHWKPFPSVKQVLKDLSKSYDLHIASGVTEDLIWEDLRRHGFNSQLFSGVYGGNSKGGADKAELLKYIKKLGYSEVLFVADSNRDLLYAQTAGTRFFRIKNNEDFIRLKNELNTADQSGLPDEQEPWSFTDSELQFFFVKTKQILENIVLAQTGYSYKDICDHINS